jgi:microcystin-dependent protein
MTTNLAPPGVVLPYAGSVAPSSWLLCDGSAVSRTTYADLFAAISTNYGVGDGSTTFNLPDGRGRVMAGKDDMGGTAANRLTAGGSGITGTTLGANGGTETHTLTSGQIPAHAHPINGGNSYYLMRTSGGAVGLTGGTGLADTVTNTSNNTGGGSAHNNTQPTLVINHIIKT